MTLSDEVTKCSCLHPPVISTLLRHLFCWLTSHVTRSGVSQGLKLTCFSALSPTPGAYACGCV